MREGWVDGEFHASDGTRHMPEMDAGAPQPPAFEGEWQEGRLQDIAQLHREHVIPDTTNDTPYAHFSLPAYDAGKTPTIDSGAAIRSGKFRVPSNAVLVSRLNPRIARVWAPASAESNAVASTEFLVLTPRTTATRAFLYYLCSSPQFWERMVLSVTGTTGSHQRVNRNDAMTLAMRFPEDAAEQHAICTVLSDVDKLIASLEALIAKKRDIKKAAMQQLLTGRTRLPGFGGEWRTGRLGDLGTLSKGRGIRRDELSETGVRCVRYGELYTRYENYVVKPVSRIPQQVAHSALPIKQGDLLFAGSGETAEEIGICVAYIGEEPVYVGGDIIVLRASGQDAVYLAHLLNSPVAARQKSRMAQGDAVVHIRGDHLAEIELPLPPLPEQRAIATVLSDMDDEIAALEHRLDKTHAIKQGMMQQLLTGTIRLPIPNDDTEDDHAHDA